MQHSERDDLRVPFIKWAGGKRAVLGQMKPHLPAKYGRYFEPFAGSAALFFELRPKRATLCDTNARLVATYRGLRDAPDEVVSLLKSYKYQRKLFLAMRARDIDRASDAEIAAWFIYLNRTGYNGLYRVNSRNLFNVPFGRYHNPTICQEAKLRACAAALRHAVIELADFERSTRKAHKGDLVYFDPPYVPLSRSSSFTSYTSGGFAMDEQTRLRDTAVRLAQRGVHVIVSNSAAPAVYELYQDEFDIVQIFARRLINSQVDGRQPIPELLMKSHTF